VARFEPFRGLRYDPRLPLDLVVSPPYDVIDPQGRARLAARHPANAVHVELPDPADGEARYHRAAARFASWMADGTLRSEPTPCYYVYAMRPPAHAPVLGVIGALGLEPFGTGVLPHERTIARDRSDRLCLLAATRANLSPIWVLSLAESLEALLAPPGCPPDATATDDEGVLHELWAVSDPEVLRELEAAVAQAPVVVADGHHRYETALDYAERCRQAGPLRGDFDAIMAFLQPLRGGTAAIRPIHRTVVHPDGVPALHAALTRAFELVRVSLERSELRRRLDEGEGPWLVTEDAAWRLVPWPEAQPVVQGPQAEPPDTPDAVAIADALEGLTGLETSYVDDAAAALEAVAADKADAALLVRPVAARTIERYARAGLRFPPKTTYFWPKPRAGMVYRRLEDAPADLSIEPPGAAN
jgi:uncharacterized protein (DUF1015 family)